MPELLHPGVYVQELSSGVAPITGVATSTAAFVGVTEKGPLPGTRLPSGLPAQPQIVTSFTDYLRRFGGFRRDSFLTYAVQAFYQNGGQRLYVVRVAKNAVTASLPEFTPPSPVAAPLLSPLHPPIVSALNQGAWGNNIWLTAQLSSDERHFRLLVMYGATLEDAQLNVVEAYDNLAFAPLGEAPPPNYAGAAINGTSQYVYVTGRITSTPPFGVYWQLAGGSDGEPLTSSADWIGGQPSNAELTGTGLYALDKVTDVALIAIPGRGDVETINAGVGYCKNVRRLQDCFFIADVGTIDHVEQARGPNPSTGYPTAADAAQFAVKGDASGPLDRAAGDYGALYFPWVFVADPIGTGTNPRILLPPSGFIAGICGRTDNARGVFKAPAGTQAGVTGGLTAAAVVSDADQDLLNPVYVNAIRIAPGTGLVVWGARTFGSEAQWRYVPVRRTAIFLRSSIYNGIQWAVFEPNDERLWASLRLNVGSFMTTQFRAGAFQGQTPREAFFVACDATTTTQQDIDLGIVNILVGFAPLKPAEFVVLKLSQKVNQGAA